MELDNEPDVNATPISIERCRELLGEEAEALTDREVALIRQHADAMGRVLVEIFLENRPTPE